MTTEPKKKLFQNRATSLRLLQDEYENDKIEEENKKRKDKDIIEEIAKLEIENLVIFEEISAKMDNNLDEILDKMDKIKKLKDNLTDLSSYENNIGLKKIRERKEKYLTNLSSFNRLINMKSRF